MKTLTVFRRLSLSLAAASIVATGGPAWAQTATPSKAEKEATREPVVVTPEIHDAALAIYLEKVDFRDATIEEVVDFISKKTGGLNILIPDSVRHIPVTFKLQNVNAVQILDAIEFTTEGRVQSGTRPGNVHYLRLGDGAAGMAKPECRVFSIATYLSYKDEKGQEVAIRELNETLRTAMDMLKQADPASQASNPRMQVNAGTKLLIAVGRPEELAVLEQVVTALQGQVVPVPPPARRGGMMMPGRNVPSELPAPRPARGRADAAGIPEIEEPGFVIPKLEDPKLEVPKIDDLKPEFPKLDEPRPLRSAPPVTRPAR
jgi:hypothetical protein